jgi:prophage tail gpP-like protein
VALNDLQVGGYADTVLIRLGDDDLKIVENYEVKVSVLQQPAAFTLRLGSGETASQILKRYPPGTPFALFVGAAGHRSQIQSGRIYSRGAPSGKHTQVEIKGRDHLAALFDDEVQFEYTFPDKTYYELTRKVLNVVGLTERTEDGAPKFALYSNNDNNRQLVSRVPTAKPQAKGELVEQKETGATSGAGKLVYQTLKTSVGTRWYDFLQQQYKLAGLFLWATGEGNFALAQPRADQPPAYKILRQRGQLRDHGNILECRFQDDVTNRHAMIIVHGRGGSGKNGRGKIFGHYTDKEMVAYDLHNVRTVHDEDIKSDQEAKYLARKLVAEERRAGWQLEYTMSGHIIPSVVAKDSTAVWCPDMVCRVDDEELDIHGNFYIEAVTFSRSPETTTTVTLMRPEDLVFADKLFSDPTGANSTPGAKLPPPKTR